MGETVIGMPESDMQASITGSSMENMDHLLSRLGQANPNINPMVPQAAAHAIHKLQHMPYTHCSTCHTHTAATHRLTIRLDRS